MMEGNLKWRVGALTERVDAIDKHLKTHGTALDAQIEMNAIQNRRIDAMITRTSELAKQLEQAYIQISALEKKAKGTGKDK